MLLISCPKESGSCSCPCPGNARELRNVIEHAMILTRDKSLFVSMPGLASVEAQTASRLDDVDAWAAPELLEQAAMEVLKEEWERKSWSKLPPGGGIETEGV